MAKKTSYEDSLRKEMGGLIDQLQLPGLYKQALKARWLDQVVWMEKKADQCRRWHYRLRLTTIVGGVILPALVGANFQLEDNKSFKLWFPYLTFGLSQIIAVSAAVEEFCRFGDRWRQYRQTVENLKTEGWQYLQSSGPYSEHVEHVENYTLFAARVESIIKEDVQTYITELIKQKSKEQAEVEQVAAEARKVPLPTTLLTAEPPPPPAPLSPVAALASSPAEASLALNGSSDGGTATATLAAPVAMASMAAMAAPTVTQAAPPAAANGLLQAPPPPAKGNLGLLKVRQDTIFKLQPKPSDTLADNEKVLVKGGSIYGLHACAHADNNHVKVSLANVGLGSENRNTWFVFAPHIEMEGKDGQLITVKTTPSFVSANGEIRLKVPYFSQRDNEHQAERTCNTSSCAMVAKYLGANISGDDAYWQYVNRHGDTTEHTVQTQALLDLGIKSTWNTNLGFDDLDKSLAAGLPIVIGIYHRGSLDAPTGGHMLVVVGRTAKGDYICNDPYGSVLDGYSSEDINSGNNVVYPRNVMSRRWLTDGEKAGWGRLFYGNKIPQA